MILGWNPPLAASSTQRWDASLVSALIKSRTTKPSGNAPEVPVVGFDDPKNYLSWAFEVRMSLLVTEFLGKVAFDVDRAAGQVKVRFASRDGEKLMADLLRPSADDILNGADGLASTQRNYPPAPDSIAAVVAQSELIDEFMLRAAGCRPEQHPRRYELVRAFSILSNLVCLRLKHVFAVPRPHEVSAEILPLLPVPGHSSFPGGHATIAASAAVVIAGTTKNTDLQHQMLLARAVADNRVSAGLHYEKDSLAGLVLGVGVAEILVAVLKADAADSTKPQDLPLLGALWESALRET